MRSESLAQERRDWDAALGRFAERLAELEAECRAAGLELRAEPVVEVDAEGRPAALLWRATDAGGSVAEPWSRRAGSRAATILLPGLPAVDRHQLAALGRELPSDAAAEPAYVRILEDGARIQLVLPYRGP